MPYRLDHINVWAIEDGEGWALVDTGMRTEATVAAWEKLFAQPPFDRPLTRVFVTHMHPDHVGMAGWLTRKFGVRLWMTALEYLSCRVMVSDSGREAPPEAIAFYTQAGWSEPAIETYRTRFGNFDKLSVLSESRLHAIAEQASALLGSHAAEGVEFMLRAAPHAATGWLAGAVGLVTLIVGATTVLTELQYDLDMIWRSPPRKSSGMIAELVSRLLSFGLVICIGFLFLASLVVSTALSALAAHGIAVLPGSPIVLTTVHVLAWGLILTICFALLYKWLPNTRLGWGDVLAGAVVTTVLFSIGRLVIGVYLTHTATGSMHGAAGALIILLLWFYYSAQVFLLGAEFTAVYARRLGSLAGTSSQAATVAT
jgi:YihY family inner membrane protein